MASFTVIIVASVDYSTEKWQLQMTFPASVDCEIVEEFLDNVQSIHDKLPSDEELLEIASDYYFDDEPEFKRRRVYQLSLKEYNRIVHGHYDDDSDMFADCMDSIQPSFCRNCGAEGQSLEPDARDCMCEVCGQNTLQSLAVALNII